MLNSLDDFRNGQNLINSLKVVKDTAERGVKLISDFNGII